MWVLGLFLMTKDTWYIGSPMILVSVFAFGVACVNGWLDDLMNLVEGYEKRMLG
jgi:UDP-N-acetylmuramyl pentapeptide phosphotransferase/UDP-N-acetylglucosamine-1-phosphate transferase